MKEIWKDIPGHEGVYQASNLGKIKSLDRTVVVNKRNGNKIKKNFKGKILRPVKKKTGYLNVILYKNKKRICYRVHILIAITFIPNPEKKETVNHKDMIKTNNKILNLEWNTCKENNDHAIKHGLIIENPVIQLSLDNKFIRGYKSISEAARKIKGNKANISRILKRKWFTAYGYKWMYADDYYSMTKKEIEETLKRIKREATLKPIIQLSKDNSFIKKFSSIVKASKELGISASSIVNVCKEKKYSKTAGGFKWRYQNEI